jgi:hypothetical protein
VITYALCLLYVALIYVRPGELSPALAPLRLPMITLVAASVSAVASVFMKPRRFANLPIDVCFLGFMLTAAVSNPFNGKFTVASDRLEGLLTLVVFYLLIRIAVQTERQMRGLVGVLILLTLLQAANGILQHWTGVGLGGTTAVMEGVPGGDTDSFDDPVGIARIRGTGFFGDPNDLAMALLLVFPFLFTPLLDGGSGMLKRLLAAGVLALLTYAVFLTHSRGGFLGLAALSAAYVYRRFGRTVAVLVAVVALVAVMAAPGRGREVSSSEASAQGRIQAWVAGFEMLKTNPIMGVGYGEFTRHHYRVAHNSFVHVFGETGLVGLFFFVGMFYWFFVANGPLRNVAGASESAMARDVWASCIGLTVCACFLSRQYVPILYLPLVLGAVRVSVSEAAAGQAGTTPAVPATAPAAEAAVEVPEVTSFGQWWDWPIQGAVTVGVVLAVYVAIRTLAV